MELEAWVKEFPGAVTVCDPEGGVLAMNDASVRMFAKSGGRELVGQNLMGCHPGDSGDKLQRLLNERKANTYTIEKGGRRILIHQTPWTVNGEYRGFVELSIELPEEMPNFVRT
jgi:transcriptional regulator with PAS, ATPase and Fis domain